MTKLQKIAAICAITLAAGLTGCGETAQQDNTENHATPTSATTTTTAETTTAAVETQETEPTETTIADESSLTEESETAEESSEPEYADEEPVEWEEIERSDNFLYRTLLNSHVTYSKYTFNNMDCIFGVKYYRKPVYRSGLGIVPGTQFYVDNLWNIFTINGDKIVDPSTEQNLNETYKIRVIGSITERYMEEAKLFILYDINDVADLLPEDRYTELKNDNINWVIVRPYYDSSEYSPADTANDYFDKIYGNYLYGDNIILEWHDDWFEEYADLWMVLTKYPIDEMDEETYESYKRSYEIRE